MKICSVEGCGRKHYGRGFCAKHYTRMYRNNHIGLLRAPAGYGHVSAKDGYRRCYTSGKLRLEHLVVAEKALGKPLPPGAEVHHVDENRSNNSGDNLVICPDKAYHKLIHQRMRAIEACGHADWRKCWVCKQYDVPGLLVLRGRRAYHQQCDNHNQRVLRAARKESKCL